MSQSSSEEKRQYRSGAEYMEANYPPLAGAGGRRASTRKPISRSSMPLSAHIARITKIAEERRTRKAEEL